MGISPHANISYGIFTEDLELPWDAEEFEGDIEVWWRSVKGYKAPFEPYTESGEYAEGWTHGDARFSEYFDHHRAWEKENTLPVELERVGCYDGEESPLLTIGGFGQSVEYDAAPLKDLEVPPFEDLLAFKTFVKQYLKSEDKPQWILSSFMG